MPSNKGKPCIYPEGPEICQEGECGRCCVHIKHRKR